MKKLFLTIYFLFLINIYNQPKSNSTEDFAIYTIENTRYVFYSELEKLEPNQKLVINFTDVHCAPCKKEIPELIKMYQSGKENKQFVLWIIFLEDTEKEIRKLFKDLKLNTDVVPLMRDPFSLSMERFNFNTTPHTFVFNKKKELLFKSEGLSQLDELQDFLIGKK